MRLASIWSDHAVIQRNKPVVVWGWCDAKRTVVRGTLGDSQVQGLTSWDGRFELRFPALEASRNSLELRVACGAEECVVRDLVVGEVWLVSGQSNAEFPLKTYLSGDAQEQATAFLAEGGEDPLLRCFTTPNDATAAPGAELPPGGEWQLSSATTAPDFTAIGAWFALNLRKHFPQVPVGIVHSSWGGTPVVAWLSREALALRPENREELLLTDQRANAPSSWELLTNGQEALPGSIYSECYDFAQFTQKDRGNEGFGRGYAAVDFDDSQWGALPLPCSWIARKFSTHGAVWVRKAVELPASWAGQDLVLHLGNIDKQDVSYFNGVQVGAMGKGFELLHWNESRAYPVPGALVKAGRNLVAVRAFSFYTDGAFGGVEASYCLENPATGERVPLCDGAPWKACVEYAFQCQKTPPQALNFAAAAGAAHRLFDNKIRPLIPFAIRGVLWYQGETDADLERTTALYQMRFGDLIRDWRRAWGQGEDFPFFFVQLANFQANFPGNWLRIQDAQRRVYLETPNTGVVTGSDLALFESHDIHPHDKRSFGRRLFLQALSRVYGDATVVPQGPTLDSLHRQGESVLCLHFQYGEGLHAEGTEELKGFEVAGADGKFFPAQAEIQGDCVAVSSPEVAEASAVRYNAEVAHPEGNLRNGAGLPALSFVQTA